MVELKTKEIEIEGTKYTIREFNADDGLGFSKYKRDETGELIKDMLRKGVIEPKEIDLTKLPLRVANLLLKEIRVLNGTGTEDFPKVPST